MIDGFSETFEIGRRWTEDRLGDALANHLRKGVPEMASSEIADDRGAGFDLPRIEVSDRHRQVQASAFGLLLDTGHPVSVGQIAERAELTGAEVDALLADFDAVGRVRFDNGGDVVGIAGLSIEPTRHRIDLDGMTRWTWCALDAIGILSALARPATYTTKVPDTDDVLEVRFGPNGISDSVAVVFVADGYGSDSVVETWCPTVNLFPDRTTAQTWAKAHDVSGQPVAVAALAADAAALWAPLVSAPL